MTTKQEEKFPTLEESQKNNPFYQRAAARLAFREKRRLMRQEELAQENEKQEASKKK